MKVNLHSSNTVGVASDIDWNSAAALEFLGALGLNKDKQPQIQAVYKIMAITIYNNKNPFQHYIKIRCDDPSQICPKEPDANQSRDFSKSLLPLFYSHIPARRIQTYYNRSWLHMREIMMSMITTTQSISVRGFLKWEIWKMQSRTGKTWIAQKVRDSQDTIIEPKFFFCQCLR